MDDLKEEFGRQKFLDIVIWYGPYHMVIWFISMIWENKRVNNLRRCNWQYGSEIICVIPVYTLSKMIMVNQNNIFILFFSQRKISSILISGRCSYQRIKRGIELRCVSLTQCSRIAFKVGIPFLAYHFMVM